MSYGTIVVPYFQPNGPRCSRVKPWVVAKQLWSFPRHVPYRESKLPLSSRAGLGRTEDPKNRDFPWFCCAFLVPFPWVKHSETSWHDVTWRDLLATLTVSRTSLLQHAIGGKGFMIMLACLAPADKYYEEGFRTIKPEKSQRGAGNLCSSSQLVGGFVPLLCSCFVLVWHSAQWPLASASSSMRFQLSSWCNSGLGFLSLRIELGCLCVQNASSIVCNKDNLSTLQYAAQAHLDR